MKRAPLILLALGGVAVVVALLFLTQGGDRADRKSADRTASEAAREARDDAATGAGNVADDATLATLIEKHGGFTSKGRVMLTLPDGPGVNLEVTLRTKLDGFEIVAKAESDGEGRYTMRKLPRASGYTLTAEGPRVQPGGRDVVLQPEDEVEFEDLILDRYYFIVGRVTAGGNKTMPDAHVEVVSGDMNNSFSFFKMAAEAAQDIGVLTAAKTESNGRYEIKLTKPGVFTLRGRASGYAPTYVPDVVVAARVDAKQDIALQRGHEVAGYVLDGNDRPIENAAVVFYATQGRRWWSSNKELTRTDATGRFELLIEPHASRYTVRAVPPKGVDISQTVQLPLTEDIILRLPGTNALTGRVVDADTQQPVANADVMIGISKPGNTGWSPDWGKPLKTDERGAFRVEGLGIGQVHSLSVRAPGFSDVQLSRMFPSNRDLWNKMSGIKLGDDSETTLPDIPIQRGQILTGIVRDKKTERPLPGAVVELWDFVMGNRAVQTDLDGMYRFDGVGQRVAMIVSSEGYATMREQPWPGYQVPQDRPEVQRDIALDPGGIVKGTVKTTSGAPVDGALVRLESAATGRGNWTVSISLNELWTHTDEKGEFTIAGVPPVKLRARAEAAGFSRAKSEDKQVSAATEARGLDIVMQPAASLSGSVRSRDGRKLRGARISVTRDPGDSDTRSQWRAWAEAVSAFANEDGEFVVTEVPLGDVLIQVEADGFATLEKKKAGVKPGQQIKGMRLEVEPAYTISGLVENTDGDPVVNCWIRVRRDGAEEGSQLMGARVDGDGTFTVRNLAAGSYTIEVRVSNWGQNMPRYENVTRAGIESGTKDVKFVLEKAEE